MPSNFSWVEEGKLAGLAYPSTPAHFKYLVNQGTAYLVSLTYSKPTIPKGNCRVEQQRRFVDRNVYL